MKFLKLSLVAIFIIGCGGDSDGSSSGSSATTESVEEAIDNVKAYEAISSLDFSRFRSSSHSYAKTSINQKETGTLECSVDGTMTYERSDDEQRIRMNFHDCTNGVETVNGVLGMNEQDSENYQIDFDNFTYKGADGEGYLDLSLKYSYSDQIYTRELNGEVKQILDNGEVERLTAKKFVVRLKDSMSESWITIDGIIGRTSKCVVGTYDFETIEKLIDARDGTDNTESGVLKINGATYTFENPYVTIKAGSEEETMLQSEFEKEVSETSTCNG